MDQTYIEEKQYEPIISMSLLFTCRAFAIFIRPIIIYVIYAYRIQTQIPILYDFRDTDLDNYLLFAFVMLSQTVNEVFILNIIETLHDWKLFDYFSYCAYRYQLRQNQWLPSAFSFDKSLQVNYRSLDNLLFSA